MFFTPYIEHGRTEEGLKLGRVSLQTAEWSTSAAHAGYITINKTYNTNFFFLHVPAQAETSSTPLVMWLQGGPGRSSLFGHYVENGRIGLDKHGNFYERNRTLQKHFSVIYLDQPVGAGYSFTDNVNGFARSLEDIAHDVFDFLRQFLLLFPRYAGRDFYVAGESYGARSALAIAHRFLTYRSHTPDLKLQGISLGVAFIAPFFIQMNTATYLRNFGLLDQTGHQIYSQAFEKIDKLVAEGNIAEALYVFSKTAYASSNPSDPTLFQKLTRFQYDGNAVQARVPREFHQFKKLVNSADFKKNMHVGVNTTYRGSDMLISTNLAADNFRDVSDMLIDVLNSYRVLTYFGQFDPVFSAATAEAFFRTLRWNNASVFRESVQRPWWVNLEDEDFAGYYKEAGRFLYAVMLGAGHYTGLDRPDALNELLYRFIADKPLLKKSEAGPGPGNY